MGVPSQHSSVYITPDRKDNCMCVCICMYITSAHTFTMHGKKYVYKDSQQHCNSVVRTCASVRILAQLQELA